MIQHAWREAVRAIQEVKAQCSQHGAGQHESACVALGESAREADRFWHHLKDEQQRRRLVADAALAAELVDADELERFAEAVRS
jgi:hypothetical protein